jgi:hypothetical protein
LASLIAPFDTIDGGEIAVRSRFDFVLVPA